MATRTVTCTNNDLIILSRQIAEFQKNAEDSKMILPAQISYIVHKNDSIIMREYTKFEKARTAVLNKYISRDKDGKMIMKKPKKGNESPAEPEPVFTDEKALDKEIEQLLKTEVTVSFYTPINVEEKIQNLSGEQKTLNQLWYLFEIFTEWAPTRLENETKE
jgi:hypothetical protein